MVGQDSQQRFEMRNKIYIYLGAIMLAPLLAGCGDPNRAKIVGIWEIETPNKVMRRFKDNESAVGEPASSRMRLEFLSGGIFKTSTSMGSVQGKKEGQWEWLSFDEQHSTAKLRFTIGLQVTEHDVLFLDDESIELIPPNMAGLDMKVRFSRSR